MSLVLTTILRLVCLLPDIYACCLGILVRENLSKPLRILAEHFKKRCMQIITPNGHVNIGVMPRDDMSMRSASNFGLFLFVYFRTHVDRHHRRIKPIAACVIPFRCSIMHNVLCHHGIPLDERHSQKALGLFVENKGSRILGRNPVGMTH